MRFDTENAYLYHCTIMSERMPSLFDPLEFADKKRHIRGGIGFEQLDRMQDVLLDVRGAVQVDLAFSKQGRTGFVKGTLDADLILECQCCMGPLKWPVHCDVSLGMVGSLDEADLLPSTLEPLLVKPDTSIPLAELVQDELLLSIPTIPRHPDCQFASKKTEAPAADMKRHPFADLAQLKK